MKLWLVVFGALILSSAAYAQDRYRHAPEACDFEITFPEQPEISKRCPRGSSQSCHDVVTYRQVFSTDSSVIVHTTCNKTPKGQFDSYDRAVLQTTLNGMSRSSGITVYDTGFQEKNAVKIATLTGSRADSVWPVLYAAQIWVSEGSIFTVRGEVIGDNNPDADRLFASILKTVQEKKPDEDSPADPDKDKVEKDNKAD